MIRPPIEKVKFLFVDDLPENLYALEALLKQDDLEIYKARSGELALELLLVHDFALAMIDVQMPEMDGFELAELMRGMERTRAVPIIFVTAGAMEKSRTFKGYEAGAVDFLHKPLDAHSVKNKVRVFFELGEQRLLLRQQVHRVSEALAEAERAKLALSGVNAELQQFNYIVSHDLKEPLRTISSFLGLLKKRASAKMDDEEKEFIDFAVNGAYRMAALIDALLDYSRATREELRREPVDLNETLKQVLASLELTLSETGAIIDRRDLPMIMADPTQMGQVLQNLITNAIKFRKDGEPPRIEIGSLREGAYWHLFVKDYGIGFPQKQADVIFRVFRRLGDREKYPGNGIGLAVCKKIIDNHQGKIWAESEVGQGSIFHFTLPVALAPLMPPG